MSLTANRRVEKIFLDFFLDDTTLLVLVVCQLQAYVTLVDNLTQKEVKKNNNNDVCMNIHQYATCLLNITDIY